MRLGTKVLIRATYHGDTTHGTRVFEAEGKTWEITNGWHVEVDPEFTPTDAELELARENYAAMCAAFDVDYDELEADAIEKFDRSKTNGKGFAVYIRRIVHDHVQNNRRVGA